jgi:two-component system, OmpR family, catabolic regulation response regulator CreB
MVIKDTILIIEDDTSITDTVEYALNTEGFMTITATTGLMGIELIKRENPDFVILDVGLPDINGFELCKSVRVFSDVPILFLTARASEIDRVVGLEIGGDDYMVKPFSPRELTARVRAILRRTVKTTLNDTLLFKVDHEKRSIFYHGQLLELARYEYLILKTLVEKPGRVYTRELLLEMLWEDPAMSTERTVDAHIKNIRHKCRIIAPKSDPIRTHRSMGYSLNDQP